MSVLTEPTVMMINLLIDMKTTKDSSGNPIIVTDHNLKLLKEFTLEIQKRTHSSCLNHLS